MVARAAVRGRIWDLDDPLRDFIKRRAASTNARRGLLGVSGEVARNQ